MSLGRIRPFRGTAPQRQRGIAMLVAILLVALGTIIATAVAYESAMSARRGTATFSFDQAVLVSEGAEALAAYGLRAVIQASAKTSSGSADIYTGQPWSEPVGPLEVVPGVTLEASLEDMTGRFNLNSLVNAQGQPDATAVKVFQQLLALLGLEPKWSDLLVDWIDPDTIVKGEGAEDSVYLGQNPPYLTANRYITSTSELLSLPGFGHDRYAKLAPFVAALPPGTKINICTAQGFVLDALLGEGHQEFSTDLEALAKNRASAGKCFPGADVFRGIAAGGQGPNPLSENLITTTSSYFRLTSLVTIGTSEFNLYSLLYVSNGGPRTSVVPIMRSFAAD